MAIFACAQIVNFQLVCSDQISFLGVKNDFYCQYADHLKIADYEFPRVSCRALGFDQNVLQNHAYRAAEQFYNQQKNKDESDDENEFCGMNVVDQFLVAADNLIAEELMSNPSYRNEFCTVLGDEIDKNELLEATENRLVGYLLGHKKTSALKSVLKSFVNSNDHVFLIDLLSRQKPEVGYLQPQEGSCCVSDTLLDNVKLLIACGINIHQVDQQGVRYLRPSCYVNNAPEYSDGAALHYAAACNATEVVRLLVEQGADVYKEDKHGMQAIDYAMGNHATFSLLLNIPGYDVNKKNTRKQLNYSANFLTEISLIHQYLYLRLTFSFVSSSILELIIENGADLASKNYYGQVPAQVAVEYGDYQSLAVLLAHMDPQDIADSFLLNRFTTGISSEEYFNLVSICLATECVGINDQDAQGETPLHYVMRTRHEDKSFDRVLQKVTFLIKQGADVNIQNNKGEHSLFSYATSCLDQGFGLDYRMVSLLLNAGANEDLRNHQGLAIRDLYVEYIAMVQRIKSKK